MSENLIDYHDLAEQIVRAQLQRDALDEQIAQLKSHFRDGDPRVQELEKDGRPTIIVKVTSNSRIDDKLAQEVLDPAEYAMLGKVVVDTAKARAFLDNEKLAKITKYYENKVEVKLA
jgi:hypothetical protein